MVLLYMLVFLAAFAVDVIPFIGPPAWLTMVFFQVHYDLDIWPVLVTGVAGSALGRYVYSIYVPLLSSRFIKPKKNEDIQFIGQKLKNHGWKVQLFVILYTLLPLPSTPLFTASGIAKVHAMWVIPAFLIGKFTSDGIMVVTGNYVAQNIEGIWEGMLTWKSLSAITLGLLMVLVFLFIDWRTLLQERKLRFSVRIWR